MASGDKNYFRHSANARNDEVILEAFNDLGYKSYHFWFVLLELCCEQSQHNKSDEYVFHESMLYRELRCTKRTLSLYLTYFQARSKLCFTYAKPMFNIRIVSLHKYLGFYKKNASNNKDNNKNNNNDNDNDKGKFKKAPKKQESKKQEVEKFQLKTFEEVINNVGEETLKKWTDRYPDHIWMKQEIEDAIEYHNLKKEPTCSAGWSLFISGWLKRAKKPEQPRRQKPQPKTFEQMRTEKNQQVYEDLEREFSERGSIV